MGVHWEGITSFLNWHRKQKTFVKGIKAQLSQDFIIVVLLPTQTGHRSRYSGIPERDKYTQSRKTYGYC